MSKRRPKKKPTVLGTKKYAGRHKREVLYIQANKGKVVTDSKFSGYDKCLNPYVGCEFGCKYCYVRFFLKDKDKGWGEFVRVRKHIETRLPGDLPALEDQRLVLGTMTDPYQPAERTHRITRSAIKILLQGKLKKVGIFTRSPIILDDIDIIAKLPRARVHFTITPYPRGILQQIEPIAIQTEARFMAVRKLKEAGIRVHCNIAPTVPFLSESFTEDFVKEMVDIGVDEFFVDPMQPYAQSMEAMKEAMDDKALWADIEKLMGDKEGYLNWKNEQKEVWFKEWDKHGHKSPDTLAIWSDHENHTWVDMTTKENMSKRLYGDDLEEQQSASTRNASEEQLGDSNLHETETGAL